MEHFVQFAINIDDEAVKRRVETSAYDDILQYFIDDIKAQMDCKYSAITPNGYVLRWPAVISDAVSDFLDKNREDIIDAAAEKLKNSFTRTKAYKEAMKNALNDEQ